MKKTEYITPAMEIYSIKTKNALLTVSSGEIEGGSGKTAPEDVEP